MTWDPAKHPRGPGGRFGHGGGGKKLGVEAITGGAPSAFAGSRGEDHVPRAAAPRPKATTARAPRSKLTVREMFGESAFAGQHAPAKKAPAPKAPAKRALKKPAENPHAGLSGFAMIAAHEEALQKARKSQPQKAYTPPPVVPLPKGGGFRPPRKKALSANDALLGQYGESAFATGRAAPAAGGKTTVDEARRKREAILADVSKPRKKKSARDLMRGM